MKTTIVLMVLALLALLLAVCVSIEVPFTAHPSQVETPMRVAPRS
jgi:hypothetical protein